MATTKAETRDRAGVDLGLIELNGSLQAQDATRIEKTYNEVYAQLKKEGLATWATTGSVPDEITPHVVALVCDNCLNTYGVSVDRYNRIKVDASGAMREIRRLVRNDHITTTGMQDY